MLRADITQGYSTHDEIYLHTSQGRNGTLRLTLGTATDNDGEPQRLLDIIDVPSYQTLNTGFSSDSNEPSVSFRHKPTFFESAGIKRLPDRIHFVLQGLDISINNAGDMIVQGRQTDFSRTLFFSSDRLITLNSLTADELQVTAPLILHVGNSSIKRLVLEGLLPTGNETDAPFVNVGQLEAQDCFLRNLKGGNAGTLNALRFSLMGKLDSMGSLISDELILEPNACLKFMDTAKTDIKALFLSPGCRFENYKTSSPLTMDRLDGSGGVLTNYGSMLIGEAVPDHAFESILNQGLFHIETGDLNAHHLENSNTLMLEQGTLPVGEGQNSGKLQAPCLSVDTLFTNTGGVSTQRLKGAGKFENRGALESTLEGEKADLTLDIEQLINDSSINARSITGSNGLRLFTNTQDARVESSKNLTFSPKTRVVNEGLLDADEITLEGPITLQKGDISARTLRLMGDDFTNQTEGDMQIGALILEGVKHLINKGILAISTLVPGTSTLQTLENAKGATLVLPPYKWSRLCLVKC